MTAQRKHYLKRYYVRREECWGGTYLWFVIDRERRIQHKANCVGRRFRSEKSATLNCEKANRDWWDFLEKS